VALLAASALDRQLGLPTFVADTAVTVVVLLISRQSPLPVLKDISWRVLPLVAGLFILALQLPFQQVSESMGNHDSKIVDAASVD
jgi:Na+/H+ antiporter NhaD/arsenite permease-like protein